MKIQLIENDGKGKQVAYGSILVAPNKLRILGSDLCFKIISELVKEPCCAMDISRQLGQHEQKIYYHLRKLENAGIIKQIRTERRLSMTANIYEVVAPVISTKLYNGGQPVNEQISSIDPKLKKFLYPFIDKGKLNAKIILGDPYPHGKYDRPSRSPVHTVDFMVLLGRLIQDLKFPHYQLDIDTSESDMNNNLILFGSPKANTIVDRLNTASSIPLYFDQHNEWAVVSRQTGKTYGEPRIGIIVKCENPFAKDKKILWIAGIRTRGMQAATIALTQKFDKLLEDAKQSGNIVRIVEGLDLNGDRIIDSVKFLE